MIYIPIVSALITTLLFYVFLYKMDYIERAAATGAETEKKMYTRKQSVILSAGYFILTIIMCYFLYLYTMSDEANHTEPFLYCKIVVANLITGCAALTDAKRSKIPNFLIIFGLVSRAMIYVAEFVFRRDSFLYILEYDGLGFAIGFLFLFVIAIITKGGIGYGDVKLFGVIGLLMSGSGVFSVLFLSLLLSSIVSIVMIAIKKKSIKSSLPMAPFIYAATFLVSTVGIF